MYLTKQQELQGSTLKDPLLVFHFWKYFKSYLKLTAKEFVDAKKEVFGLQKEYAQRKTEPLSKTC